VANDVAEATWLRQLLQSFTPPWVAPH
jgi:hypothetical protein